MTEPATRKINFAEKIDGKFPEIEKFMKCWVRVEWSFFHRDRGLMLFVCREPDNYGKMKDYAVVRSIYENVASGLHSFIEIGLIKSIEIDQELEINFERATPERQKEMLEWFENGQTLKQKLTSLNM